MAKASKSQNKRTENTETESFIKKVSDFFSNDTVRFIIGIILFFLGVFMLVSELSFILSGNDDYNLLTKGVGELRGETKTFDNICSAAGANLANAMINNWFGISSFLMPVFLLILGHRLCNPDTKYSIFKYFVFCFFVMIWTSVLLGALAPNSYLNGFVSPGGLHGIVVADYLYTVIGPVGISIILAVTMITYLSVSISSFVPKIQQWMNADNWRRKPDPVTDNPESDNTSGNTDDNLFTVNPIDDSDQKPVDVVTDTPVDTPIETPIDTPIETPIETPLDIDSLDNVGDAENSDLDNGLNTSNGTEVVDTPSDPENIEMGVEIAKDADSQQVTQVTAASLVEKYGEYDPTLELSHYKLPTYNLLKDYGQIVTVDALEQQENKNRIIAALKSYRVFIKDIKATIGPTITLYEIVPVEGTRISKIKNLEDDIAMSIAAKGIRIIAPMPGKGTIGIEVPNKKPQTVSMQSVIASKKFQETEYDLPVALGKTITDEVFMIDLAKMPHLLVAGATGQGKSVGLNAIIVSLLYKKHPSQLKIVLVDPKKTEFSIYSDIDKHFLAKLPENEDAVITNVDKVIHTLKSICKEMDDRNDLLKKAHVRNIKEYNAKFVKRELNPDEGHHYLPYMVVIIDEYGDLILTAGKEVELPIARIAAVARAAGIHMVIATQRPSANIVTGLIKANFPARMAFKVASMIDSRTILDTSGANQLIGRGDMLFLQGSELTRVQCAFVDTPEVQTNGGKV